MTVPKGVPGLTPLLSVCAVCSAISFSWSKQLLKSASPVPTPQGAVQTDQSETDSSAWLATASCASRHRHP